VEGFCQEEKWRKIRNSRPGERGEEKKKGMVHEGVPIKKKKRDGRRESLDMGFHLGKKGEKSGKRAESEKKE